MSGERAILVVLPVDEEFSAKTPQISNAIRASASGLIDLIPEADAIDALTVEGDAASRQSAIADARVSIARAEERFRQLDDEVALSILAKATTELAAAHQDEAAIPLLAETHLLAGAMYLARDRVDAARKRLQRALDLEPELTPARDRYTPRLLAEVAGIKAAEAQRPNGRLSVAIKNTELQAEVFLDGRPVGRTPLTLDTVGAGRHLVRISAPGRKSHITSVDITPETDAKVVVQLPIDPELSAIIELPSRWRTGAPIDDVLELIAKRAGADRTLLAVPALSLILGADGRTGVGVSLQLSGVPSVAFASSIDPDALRGTLSALVHCEPVLSPPALAPALLGGRGAVPEAGAPSEPGPLWDRPWFWVGAALAAVLASSAVVLARTRAGPPEAVDITLIPRP